MDNMIIYTDGEARGNPGPVVAAVQLLLKNPRLSTVSDLLSDTENFRFPTLSHRT